MKILFTGGSSFTGCWFVKELVEHGHDVVMTLRGSVSDYTSVRQARIEKLQGQCRFLENVSFGDESFLAAIAEENQWDVLCHHAADVTNYKSPEFNVNQALENNTKNVEQVLQALSDKGCQNVVLTGSVFECDEGAGSEGLEAFSPYGLSKALTASVFRYRAQSLGLTLGKFVIPNPFGPFEEPRFTSYLAKTWLKGETAGVRTPDYVRDNIHVSLLAKEYHRFVHMVDKTDGFLKLGPSGYVGGQGDFAFTMSREMKNRLNVPCDVNCSVQESFDEPRIRINTDVPAYTDIDWDEAKAWDDLAEYYLASFKD